MDPHRILGQKIHLTLPLNCETGREARNFFSEYNLSSNNPESKGFRHKYYLKLKILNAKVIKRVQIMNILEHLSWGQ